MSNFGSTTLCSSGPQYSILLVKTDGTKQISTLEVLFTSNFQRQDTHSSYPV